jgi:hypothetical protein
MDEKTKKQLKELQELKLWNPGDGLKNWRAWGSWFSWGSPIGLTLGYAIVMVSTGVFLWLLALSQHVK